jgi:hypothetical protein
MKHLQTYSMLNKSWRHWNILQTSWRYCFFGWNFVDDIEFVAYERSVQMLMFVVTLIGWCRLTFWFVVKFNECSVQCHASINIIQKSVLWFVSVSFGFVVLRLYRSWFVKSQNRMWLKVEKFREILGISENRICTNKILTKIFPNSKVFSTNSLSQISSSQKK